MTPFYYYPNFTPTCEVCFFPAGRGGSRIVQASGASRFVCQGCRDTVANIIFLVPNATDATALINHGFCQLCLSKPSGGICCDDCMTKNVEELVRAARKGTALVTLANALQEPGAREQMLEVIANVDNGEYMPFTSEATTTAAMEQLHIEQFPGHNWPSMAVNVEFGVYPNRDFQFGNNSEFIGMDVLNWGPLGNMSGGGSNSSMPVLNSPFIPFLPRISETVAPYYQRADNSSNSYPILGTSSTLADGVFVDADMTFGLVEPQGGQQPPRNW